jgi:hypothetical protein
MGPCQRIILCKSAATQIGGSIDTIMPQNALSKWKNPLLLVDG